MAYPKGLGIGRKPRNILADGTEIHLNSENGCHHRVYLPMLYLIFLKIEIYTIASLFMNLFLCEIWSLRLSERGEQN
jgi:hypothetical protein